MAATSLLADSIEVMVHGENVREVLAPSITSVWFRMRQLWLSRTLRGIMISKVCVQDLQGGIDFKNIKSQEQSPQASAFPLTEGDTKEGSPTEQESVPVVTAPLETVELTTSSVGPLSPVPEGVSSAPDPEGDSTYVSPPRPDHNVVPLTALQEETGVQEKRSSMTGENSAGNTRGASCKRLCATMMQDTELLPTASDTPTVGKAL